MMRKGETVRQYIDAVAKAKRAGLRVKTYIMYGFPGEGEEDRALTLRLLRLLRPHKVTVSRFAPIPGSDVWLNPRKYGLTEEDVRTDGLWFYPDEEDPSWQNFSRRVREAAGIEAD